MLLLLLVLSPAAFAQSGSPWAAPFPGLATNTPMTSEGEVLSSPQCFRVVNQAPYTITGSLYTNYYVNKNRQRARHTSNFRLEKGKSQPFCTYGPFYEGQKLDFVLRTMVPIFSCRTKVNGDIYVMGKELEGGGTKSWAACLK